MSAAIRAIGVTPHACTPQAALPDSLDQLVAAAGDALSQEGAPPRRDVTHIVLAGAAAEARALGDALGPALGLDATGCTIASARGGAAGLAALRIADACCRGRVPQAVLVACLGHVAIDEPAPPTASAALVCGPGGPSGRRDLRIERVATWAHRAELGEMTLSRDEDGFELEPSGYLAGVPSLDLGALLSERVGVTPAEAAALLWAVDADAPALEMLSASLALPSSTLEPSRESLRRHGVGSAPTCWTILRTWLDAAPGTRGVAVGFGPGPTIEAVRLARG